MVYLLSHNSRVSHVVVQVDQTLVVVSVRCLLVIDSTAKPYTRNQDNNTILIDSHSEESFRRRRLLFFHVEIPA